MRFCECVSECVSVNVFPRMCFQFSFSTHRYLMSVASRVCCLIINCTAEKLSLVKVIVTKYSKYYIVTVFLVFYMNQGQLCRRGVKMSAVVVAASKICVCIQLTIWWNLLNKSNISFNSTEILTTRSSKFKTKLLSLFRIRNYAICIQI